jgi:hypothetical protein
MNPHTTICIDCINGLHRLCPNPLCSCVCREPDFEAWCSSVRQAITMSKSGDILEMMRLPMSVLEPAAAVLAAAR